MSEPDQNEENKPVAVMPAPTPTPAAASPRKSLLTETFEIMPNPSVDEIIRTMARMANFCNLYAAEALRARVVTAANPCVMALMNVAANLEQGAQAQRQQLAMAAAGQFVGGPPPGGGMPGTPFRMN